MRFEGSGRSSLRLIAVAFAFEVLVSMGVVAYAVSPEHQRHDPNHGLQQFDAFYLDEPAPFADNLNIVGDRPALIVICRGCPAPELESEDVQVVMTGDPRIAEAYALLTEDGRVGPGYAIVDARRNVRYRTFDPGLADHAAEIAILIEAAS